MSFVPSPESALGRRTCQVLHQEHEATSILLMRLGALLERQGGESPDRADVVSGQLLRETARALDDEVLPHFAFEEERLLPRLASDGERELAEQLADEHAAMRPLIRELIACAGAASGEGFSAVGWQRFRRVAQELCHRLDAHVQAEERGLLPFLEENLDETTDEQLHATYTGNE